MLDQDVADDGDLSQIQDLLGVCLQRNILCDDLTCGEQLSFMAGMKGVARREINRAVSHRAKLVDIKNKC